MKTVVAILLVSCLIAVTYAAPSKTNVQQDDNDSAKVKELINLLSRAAQSQQDEDGDSAEAQIFGKLFRGAKKLFSGHRRGIFKGLGRFAGGALNGYMNQGAPPAYGGGGGGYAEEESDDYAFEQDNDNGDDLAAAIESLPEEARVQIFGLLKGLFKNFFG